MTGDLRDWTRFFKAHAKAENRRFGRIKVKEGMFVIDDGRRIPLRDCRLWKAADDERLATEPARGRRKGTQGGRSRKGKTSK